MINAQPSQDEEVPIFFLSHARSRDKRAEFLSDETTADDPVVRFYRDLCSHVRQLVGTRTGMVPGFVDLSAEAGVLWNPMLRHVLAKASVFVALLSPDYMDSVWCRAEWRIFSQRRPGRLAGGDGTRQTTIVPVTWVPIPQNRIRPEIQEVQRFIPSIQVPAAVRKDYRENGIYGQQVSELGFYNAVVWHLARHISELFYTVDLPPGEVITSDQLRDELERAARE